MSSGLLPDHIEPLVDRLRAGDHLPIALPDVAAVTEILMRSLESYFKSIDLTLYKECQSLADYIDDARSEISSLSPDHDDSAGIPRAGQELDAIVEATESATDTIMQAAEDLMSIETQDFDEYKDHVNVEVMKIFEACSFQDITGQRISKVVGTLNQVEDRVGKLITILGITSNDDVSKDAKPILDDLDTTDEDLLNGPALDGEGIDQGEVDSLLNGTAMEVDDVPAVENETPVVDEVSAEPETINAEASEMEVDDIPAAENETPVVDETAGKEASAEPAATNIEPSEMEVKDDTSAEIEEEIETEAVKDDIVVSPAKKGVASLSTQKAFKEVASNEGASKETSQEDIDSLFG